VWKVPHDPLRNALQQYGREMRLGAWVYSAIFKHDKKEE